jgi:hypothetical protein
MPTRSKIVNSAAPLPGQPSPRVMKLQILGAMLLPALLLGLWLHQQGFW